MPSRSDSAAQLAEFGLSPAVRQLTDEFWSWQLDRQWYLRLRAGLPVESLPDHGSTESARQAHRAQTLLDQVRGATRTATTGADDDTLGYLAAIAARVLTHHRHYWVTPAVTPYQLSDVTITADLVLGQFTFTTGDDGRRYLSLVADLATGLRSVAEKVQGQAHRGIYLPRAALDGVLRTVLALPDSLARQLTPAPERLRKLSTRDRGQVIDTLTQLIESDVSAAAHAIADAVGGDHRSHTTDAVGLHQYPGGDEAYRDFVAMETTLDVDVDQLHRLGLEECSMLSERMREVRAQLGHSGDEAEFHARLAHEPRLYAADPDEVAVRFEGYVSSVELVVDDYFSVLPSIPYGVARLDPAMEGGLTFGYYEPATRTQPIGLYRYNGSSLETRSLLTAAAVIYHELIPGHHFHVARQAENLDLHPLRRDGFFDVSPAYMEGWAEYAAGLGWGMGLYDDPWDAYGRLAQERLTATRLVVDTAMNTGRWSLEEARTFMRANIIDTEPQIVTESLRYSTDMPAQGLAYRTGFLAFDKLRKRVETASGADFDQRQFHEWVVGCGTLPLSALEARVERLLQATSRPAPDDHGLVGHGGR
jgi:uncharacterized protein (DUF885 family)